MLIPQGEPFFLPGGRTGCLLVHGFTGAPTEMRPLGEYLAARGCTVLGIRLFAHATRVEDMTRSRWQDWAACVEDGWHLINSAADEIFIIGLSMGGALSFYTAPKFPFRGVIGLSTPLEINTDPRLENIERLVKDMPFVDKDQNSGWYDPSASEGHISYERYPLRGIIELFQLLKMMKTTLPEVSIPTLLMQSREDSLVPPENMPAIYQLLGTPENKKTMTWVERSGHVITCDAAKEDVFRQVYQFIDRWSD